MHRHATMNRIYRLIWSHVLGAWVAVAENSRTSGKSAARKLLLATMAASAGIGGMVCAAPPVATQLPTGGQVVAGTLTLQQNGAHADVLQASQRGIVEWQSFNVGAQATVNFVQPSATAVTLNRVLDTQASQIFGKISANGQVFLVNPNGVYFAPGASVDVGGLVASTHSMSNADFMSGDYRFTRNGASGSVINDGTLNASLGGYIALLAPTVRNNGVVFAQAGTVALAAGEAMRLQIDGANLSGVVVDPSSFAALVENRLAVRAPGGLIILSAQALNSVLGGVVNNSGSLEASDLVSNGGRVMLTASDNIIHTGTIHADAKSGSGGVGGSVMLNVNADNQAGTNFIHGLISARGDVSGGAAGGAGAGGSVETSAQSVTLGTNGSVDTRGSGGTSGSWHLDSGDFKVMASGGNISGNSLANSLANTNVAIEASVGNVLVGDTVSWNSINTLNLSAANRVQVNAPIRNADSNGKANGKVLLRADSGGACITGSTACSAVLFGNAGTVTAAATEVYTNQVDAVSANRVSGPLDVYQLINDVTQLQAIDAKLDGKFALGRSIDANPTSGWNNGGGFIPLGASTGTEFTGVLNGLSHTVNNLWIDRPTESYVGLFSKIGAGGAVRNVGLEGGEVKGNNFTGSLAGSNAGSIESSYSRAAVKGNDNQTGGLVGTNKGAISDSFVSGSVTGVSIIGGLTSQNEAGASIRRSWVAGKVTGTGNTIGGLVGSNKPSAIIDFSHTTGDVIGGEDIGGLVGTNTGTVSNSHASGNITAGYSNTVNGVVSDVPGVDAGGLIGFNAGELKTSYATGNVNASINAGGLVGYNFKKISNSYATGDVVARSENAGGLAGTHTGELITNSYSTSKVSAVTAAGGLIGLLADTSLVTALFWDTGTSGKSHAVGKVYKIVNSNPIYTHDVDLAGTVGKTTGQMKTQSTFSNAQWDFTTQVWRMNAAINNGYPYLFGLNDQLSDSQIRVAVNSVSPGSVYGEQIAPFSTGLYSGTTLLDRATLDSLGLSVSGAAVLYGLPGTNAAPGTYTPVYNSGLTLRGTNAAGYILTPDTGASYTIDKRPLMLSASRAYDGSTRLDASIMNASNLVGTDCGSGLSTCGLGGYASATSANAGAGPLALNMLTLNNPYYTLSGASGSGAITQKMLAIINMAAQNKVYDGSTAARITGAELAGLVSNETLTLSGINGAFFDRNVGNSKSVAITSLSLQNGTGLASNYALSSLPGLRASITPKELTVDGMSASHRIYDGTTGVLLAGGTLQGVVAGEQIAIATRSGNFLDKNAAAGKPVLVNSISLDDGGTGQANNYTVRNPVSIFASIAPKALSIIGMKALDKTYDGNTTAVLKDGLLDGVVAGDTLNFTGASGAFADKNAASAKPVTVSGVRLLDDGSGTAANYTLNNPSGITASIARKALSIQGMSALNKTYDGSVGATLSGGVLDGVLTGESVSFSGASGTFADRNAGTTKPVSVNGLFLNDGGTGQAANYTLVTPAGLSAKIARKALSISGMTARDKTYDGNTSAVLQDGVLDGVVSGDTLAFTGARGAFADKNAGDGKTVSVSGIVLVDGGSGQANNYQVSNPVGLTAAIKRRALSIIGMSAVDKLYDGDTTALLNDGVLDGVVNGETLNFIDIRGNFADKNVGHGKPVVVTGVRLEDGGNGQALNYTIANPTGFSAAIKSKPLSIIGMTARDRAYDGSLLAVLDNGVLDGVVDGEALSFTGARGAFADKNAGSAKPVSVSGITLDDKGSGAAANYTLSNPLGLSATILPKALNIIGMTAADKTYDGGTLASLSGGVLSGVVAGESLRFSGASGAFADKNAGAGKSVGVTGALLDDGGSGQAANYQLSNPLGLSAAITPKSLTISGLNAADKTYDGTTLATLSGGALQGLIASEGLDILARSGDFADKNAGNAKAVNINSIMLASTASGKIDNYTLILPAAITASITRKKLTVSGMTASDKTYDGTVSATLNGGWLDGVLAGESVGFTGASATFADKNAGVGKTVTVTDVNLNGGSDMLNYTVSNPAGLTATIMRKALNVIGMTASDKIYDGATSATLNGGRLDGVIGAESVRFSGASGAFVDKNASSGKSVDVSGITLDDGGSGQASNYTLSNPTGLTAAIARKALTVSGMTASDKIYDGNAVAALSGGTLQGLVGNEMLDIATRSGSFADKNAASGKRITVNMLGLSSTASGNADNYSIVLPTSLTASITPKALTIKGMTAADKTYDGADVAVLREGKVDGMIDGDSLAFTGAIGVFADKNVGKDKAVKVAGVTLTDGGTGQAANYSVSNPLGLTASIAPKALSIKGMTARAKTYDGSTAADLDGGKLEGLVAGEALGFSGASGLFEDRNAGTGKTVIVSGLALVDGANGQALNYTIRNPAGVTGSITPRALSISGLMAEDKIYDATVTAILSGGTLTGMVSGETLAWKRGSGMFADKNVGKAKPVIVTGLALADGSGLAANYTVGNPPGLSAAITPRDMAIQAVLVNDKVYDGNAKASLASAGRISPLEGDAVLLNTTAVTANFNDGAVGKGKPVLVTGYSTSGADRGNYRLLPPGPLSADIMPAPIPPLDLQPATPVALPALCQNFPALPTVNLATGELTILASAAELPADGGSEANAFGKAGIASARCVGSNNAEK